MDGFLGSIRCPTFNWPALVACSNLLTSARFHIYPGPARTCRGHTSFHGRLVWPRLAIGAKSLHCHPWARPRQQQELANQPMAQCTPGLAAEPVAGQAAGSKCHGKVAPFAARSRVAGGLPDCNSCRKQSWLVAGQAAWLGIGVGRRAGRWLRRRSLNEFAGMAACLPRWMGWLLGRLDAGGTSRLVRGKLHLGGLVRDDRRRSMPGPIRRNPSSLRRTDRARAPRTHLAQGPHSRSQPRSGPMILNIPLCSD